MAKVTKKGFGPWKKTIVEHNGKTDTYKGNAKIENNGDTICVTETNLLSENSACYLNKASTSNTNSSLLDGPLVGKSSSITVETSNGERKTYDSGILSINSMEKSGETVQIVKNGVFGKKVIDTINANDIDKIESEDCNVCKATNPIYQD